LASANAELASTEKCAERSSVGAAKRVSEAEAERHTARVAGVVPQVPTAFGVLFFMLSSNSALTFEDSEFIAGLRKRDSKSEISSFFSFAVNDNGTWYCWSTVRLMDDSACDGAEPPPAKLAPEYVVGTGGTLTRTVSPGL
jgi:hypothetical protein